MRNLFLITALFILSPFMYANIFFDDFDGNDLADWWTKYGNNWEYEVSESMLKVKRLWGGSGNYSSVTLVANLPAFNDFEMTARVGWDPGMYQILDVTIYNSGYETPPTGGIIFFNIPDKLPYILPFFGYKEGKSIPAPDSGIHEFRFVRQNKVLYAYFNGELIDQAQDKFPFKTDHIRLRFWGKDLDEFAPLYVDMVQVIPEPMSIIALVVGVTYTCLRRRKQNGR